MHRAIFAALLLCATTFAPARALDVDQMPIKLGDTYQTVKDAYKTELEPEPMKSTLQPGSTALRLKTKGAWFFFARDGKIYTIRLDAPWAGNVGGVKIGDSATQMQKVLGKPAKVPATVAALQARTYIYYLDDVTTVGFRTDNNDEIETIFLSK